MITTKLENHPKIHIAVTYAFAIMATVFFMLWYAQSAKLQVYADANDCWRVVRKLGPTFAAVRPIISTHPRCNVLGSVRSEADVKLLASRLDEGLSAEQRKRIFVLVRVDPTTEPSGE